MVGAKRHEGKRRPAMLLDLEILDCPICYEALTIPIFQCDNGHLACSSCCPKLNNKCPTCDLPIGHSRCRAMETVLESLFVPCRCAELVCSRQVSYGKESTHEKECNFSPCSQENLEFFDAPENLCECHDASSQTAMPQPHLEDMQEEPLHTSLPQAAPYFLPRDSSRFPLPPRVMDFQSQEIIVTLNTENECMEMNEECDEETQGLVRSETQAITVFDSNQHLKADVWKDFVSVGVGEDGKERGHCINCGRKFIIERIYGTSHLRRHLLSCQKKPENKSGGNGEQDRHKHNSTDVKGALVSKYSCDIRVRNIVWKRRKRRSTSEGKISLAMLLVWSFDALTIPIFQSDNGHLACSSCCPKLSNKCPTCASPIGHNRCRAMESVLESVFVPCRNAKFGCTKKVCYGKESTHEKECTFYLIDNN